MAKISYNEIGPSNNTQGNTNYPVKFFNLKNGENAIVRILIDSEADFDIRTVHKVKMDGMQYGRSVNCIMENGDSRTCPLCERGDKLEQRLYIRMLKYTVEPNGKVTSTPMIWERSRFDKSFGTQPLANQLRDYGPLSEIICRISRSGEGLNTVYTATFGLNMMPATKDIYKDEVYVKDTSAFGDFDVLGVSIMDKSYDELIQFVQTGNFPVKNPNEGVTPRAQATENNISAPKYTVGASDSTYQTVNTTADAYATTTTYTAPQQDAMPWANTNSQFNRPRRY